MLNVHKNGAVTLSPGDSTMFSTAYAAKEASNVAVNTNAWDAILSASPVVKLTLVILLSMSIISWAIIFFKWKHLKAAEQGNHEFLDFFWRANSLEEVYEKLAQYQSSPLAQIFRAGFIELKKIAQSSLGGATQNPSETAGTTPKLLGFDNLPRALRKATDIELSHLESRLTFLATTGSTGPFIGLFGTVWGIYTAFHRIGQTGAASLAVVAPGISEALIATAIGLGAAIPAVVAYNHFISKVKRHELDMSNFDSDFLNIAKRNFFKDEA